jgi:hypothetical protein
MIPVFEQLDADYKGEKHAIVEVEGPIWDALVEVARKAAELDDDRPLNSWDRSARRLNVKGALTHLRQAVVG